MTTDKKPYTEILTTEPDLDIMAKIVNIISRIKEEILDGESGLGDGHVKRYVYDTIDLSTQVFPAPPLAEFGLDCIDYWLSRTNTELKDGTGGVKHRKLPLPRDIPDDHTIVGIKDDKEVICGRETSDYCMKWFNRIDVNRKVAINGMFYVSTNAERIAAMLKERYQDDPVKSRVIRTKNFRIKTDVDQWICDMCMEIYSIKDAGSIPIFSSYGDSLQKEIKLNLIVQFASDSDHMISAKCEYPDGASFTLFENCHPEPDDFRETTENPKL